MERKVAKELLHVDGWLKRVDEVVDRGEAAYLDEALLQEAGDSLMMKVGEAANRLARMGVLEPDGVQWALAVANRNFLIHQYDQIDRSLTWLTLARDLPAWRKSLQALTVKARGVIGDAENG
ncbi:MAG: HepT-like ribonuclease domain-containing protein [Marmoricola sp.]